MKKSILIMLAAAMPVFAQEPAPVAPQAPVAAPAVVDADNDGKISTAEAHAAKKNFMRANAHRFAKPGMNKEGRRPMGPKMGNFGPKAPKAGKPEGRRHGKPGMNKEGRRPEAPKAGQFGPKAPKFNMNKQGRREAPKCGQFAPKAPKFDMNKKGFGPKAPKCGGCKCGKKHAA